MADILKRGEVPSALELLGKIEQKLGHEAPLDFTDIVERPAEKPELIEAVP